MIESNVRLEMDVEDYPKKYCPDLNISVMAMIFYLILGEIITSASKFELISSNFDKIGEDIVKGHLKVCDSDLIINLEKNIGELKILSNMKLLNYLVDLENLSLKLDNQSIVLSAK